MKFLNEKLEKNKMQNINEDLKDILQAANKSLERIMGEKQLRVGLHFSL